MNITIDTTSGSIALSIDGALVATLTASQTHKLIDQLAQAAGDLEQVPQTFEPAHPSTRHAGGTWAWYCAQTGLGQLLIALRHPTLGWIVNALPNLDAMKMSQAVEHQLATFNAWVLSAVVQKLGESGAIPPQSAPIVPAAGSDTVH